MLHVEASRHGFGELGMLVDRDWRGRGVGSALVQAAISRARGQGLHKLCLEVFAHNTAAIALYRKSGFAEEGRRTGRYRRASGELLGLYRHGSGAIAIGGRKPDHVRAAPGTITSRARYKPSWRQHPRSHSFQRLGGPPSPPPAWCQPRRAGTSWCPSARPAPALPTGRGRYRIPHAAKAGRSGIRT